MPFPIVPAPSTPTVLIASLVISPPIIPELPEPKEVEEEKDKEAVQNRGAPSYLCALRASVVDRALRRVRRRVPRHCLRRGTAPRCRASNYGAAAHTAASPARAL